MEPHKHLKRSIYVPGGVYHVTSAVNNREVYFEDARYRFILLKELTVSSILKNFDILAVAIIPEHFHLIIRIHEYDNSKIMHSVKRTVSRKINLMAGTYVFRWQHSFYDRLLRGKEEIKAYCRYVVNNPSKHDTIGFTWPIASETKSFSKTSINNSLRKRMGQLVNERINSRRRFHRVKTDAKRDDIKRSIAAINGKIDTLVYEFYGINEEDI